MNKQTANVQGKPLPDCAIVRIVVCLQSVGKSRGAVEPRRGEIVALTEAMIVERLLTYWSREA